MHKKVSDISVYFRAVRGAQKSQFTLKIMSNSGKQ